MSSGLDLIELISRLTVRDSVLDKPLGSKKVIEEILSFQNSDKVDGSVLKVNYFNLRSGRSNLSTLECGIINHYDTIQPDVQFFEIVKRRLSSSCR